MAYYRARFPEESLKQINEAMTLEKAKPEAKAGAEKKEPPPEGVAPGEKTEKIIDILHKKCAKGRRFTPKSPADQAEIGNIAFLSF